MIKVGLMKVAFEKIEKDKRQKTKQKRQNWIFGHINCEKIHTNSDTEFVLK